MTVCMMRVEQGNPILRTEGSAVHTGVYPRYLRRRFQSMVPGTIPAPACSLRMKQQLAKLFSIILMACGHGRGNAVYAQQPIEPFHALSATDINGKPFSFAQLKGHKVIVVNTASECGYTPQYKQLQELYAKYKEKGLIIVGFPSNDFGNQEPGGEKSIAAFCEKNYGVTFPMMGKVITKGEGQHPVYQWLTQKAKNGASDSVVKWNFGKYLVNEDGSLHTMLASAVDPLSDQVLNWLDGKK